MSLIISALKEHTQAVDGFFNAYAKELEQLAVRVAKSLQSGKKLLLAGNGGSACDALHIAGEFIGRFVNDRRALPALALSADSGILTAVGNDYGFEHIFSRQVEALGQEGDIFIALSTSGSSPNILKALEAARRKKLYSVLFTGEKGKERKEADQLFTVPSLITARIQETHHFALHLLCALVEAELFGEAEPAPLSPTRYGDWEKQGKCVDF